MNVTTANRIATFVFVFALAIRGSPGVVGFMRQEAVKN
jgi:hypothetical protein